MTLPTCPIEIYPHFNPSQGTMFFEESDETCSTPTKFKLPFFLKRYGPKFQEWSVVAHETRPGHHSQAQGNHKTTKGLAPDERLCQRSSSHQEGGGVKI